MLSMLYLHRNILSFIINNNKNKKQKNKNKNQNKNKNNDPDNTDGYMLYKVIRLRYTFAVDCLPYGTKVSSSQHLL